MKQFTKRQFTDILKNNGYWLERTSGSHYIYKNTDGQTISVPQSCKSVVLLRLIKEHSLKEDKR